MKNKKTILATVFALILALSVVTASATAAAAKSRQSLKGTQGFGSASTMSTTKGSPQTKRT